MEHPFENVTLKRISQAHPRFLETIHFAKLRREIDMGRAKQHLGVTNEKRKNDQN